MCVLNHFSFVQLLATLWTVAPQAPLSLGFSRQEYWSALPCLPPGDLPNPGVKLTSLRSPALAGGFLTTSTTWEVQRVGGGEVYSFPGPQQAIMKKGRWELPLGNDDIWARLPSKEEE